MRYIIIATALLFFSLLSAFGQKANSDLSNLQNTSSKNLSNILWSGTSDTLIHHLEVKNAAYDLGKNHLPYYTAYYNTPYYQSAKLNLTIKKIEIVKEPHASVIKKYFAEFLTSQFDVNTVPSISRDINLNQNNIIPFRINSQQQVEELVDYEVTWQTVNNDNISIAKQQEKHKTSSVLSTGIWYKLAIAKSGIYKINKNFLNSMGINTVGLDPRNIRIYGNGGTMLAEAIPQPSVDGRPDDLIENAIKVVGEEDGVFDNTDYILFYGSGTTEWKRTKINGTKFRPSKNLYSDSSFYFINFDHGKGLRVNSNASLSGGANTNSNSYDYYNFHETNAVNFGKSGREFYGEYFDINNAYDFKWDDGNFVAGDSIAAEVSLVAAHTAISEFTVTGSGINFRIFTIGITGKLYSDYASAGSNLGAGVNPNSDVITLNITKVTPKSVGWLDKVTVNARRRLVVNGKQFNWRDTRSFGKNKITEYTIDVPANVPMTLWNVTNPLNPFEQQFSASGSTLRFTVPSTLLQEYCVSTAGDFLTPTFNGQVLTQNLHSVTQAQFVIVAHPLFLKEAHRLAQFHLKYDNLTYAIATTEQIYNEFSSGRQDVAAIRDFIRMIYDRNFGTTTPLKYVLLMGDGSYNNMNRNLVNNSNLIPTYQSNNSLSSTSSIVTDDFFALMNPGEGANAESTGKIDIGVGRLPCRNTAEVRAILAKIENYYRKDPNFVANASNPTNCNALGEDTQGDWRNWLVFLGDDEDGAEHMKQADALSGVVKNIDKSYNYDKIFLDAYQRFSTPGGPRYPDASADFERRIKKGALIFNYTGHGGETGLTAERMIDIDIINRLDNFNRLPLFITATCEFSRYDDPQRTSAGELCLLNPKGGAIALFTTARLAYSNYNFDLNTVVLEKLFSKLPDGGRPTLGDAIQLTKSDPRVNISFITNFHLLGDPAMKLYYPNYKVNTTHVNNLAVSTTRNDTLSALSRITVSGFVSDANGNKKTDFNGIVYPTVFDKEQTVSALMNTQASAANLYTGDQPDSSFHPFRYKVQKNVLYRGKTSVTNGDFTFTFPVPKDISFAPGPGKISYYATDGNTDASGSHLQLVVGGNSNNTITDSEGPKAQLFINERNFINGGLTNEKPILYAELVDSSGINTVGTGIGHDVSLVLDDNKTRPIILNDYYEANLNSYQSGRVRYPFEELSQGEHRLSFRVYDIQNNSSEANIDFVVAESGELALKHVLNYPNPFTSKTKFMFEHNQACNPLKVIVQVYTVSGKLVKTIQQSVVCEGFRPQGIDWDGRDDFGDKLAKGVYIYKLGILDIENKKAEKIEKLVILN